MTHPTMGEGLAAPADTNTPRVLLVGRGRPATGGIPSFVADVLHDPWLRDRVRLEHLNTTSEQPPRPGAATFGNALLALSQAYRTYTRAREVDVVHINVAPAPTLPLARAMLMCAAARAGRASTILHAHSGRLDTCAQSPLYRALLRTTLSITDAFVVVSASGERVVTSVGGAAKVVRLPNGIDVRRFAAMPKTTDPPLLTFVGTVCERKGLLDLRDALVDLRERRGLRQGDLQVFIVGDSTQEGVGVDRRIRRAYERAGLGWVEFTGALERDGVRQILARSSILCLPSHWEGFPLSVLEGMASGAAIIATRVGDIPWMVDEAGILVEPGDVDALAGAIERLVTNHRERERMGRAARARVERDFNRENMTSALLTLYAGHSM
jgi:glycosyltransferase involved in cell wall biosynthesis